MNKAGGLDSGCNNHIIVNKKWFTMLDESVKKVIRFANGRHVTSTGRGNIVVFRRDSQKVSITDVLYVPSMTTNVINICQLLAKGYKMKVEKSRMKMYNGEERMILKEPLAENKTFKIDIDKVDH